VPLSPLDEGEQHLVDAHFQATASDWEALYEVSTLSSLVYRDRRRLALAWIDGLRLPAGAPILEVGSGANLTATTLASHGLTVTAIDRVPAMLETIRRHAAEADISDRLTTIVGDVHALDFDDECFALVLALGVLPWLHSPNRALDEMTRVLQPGGYVLASADNRGALTGLFEPLENPLLHPAKEAVKRALQRRGRRQRAAGRNRPISRAQLQRLLTSLGLEVVAWTTFGFGPFTAFRRSLLPESLGATLYHRLQASADRGVPGLRSAGAQHLFLARKQVRRDPVPSR
jgi:ubiquinone/menaquinone biosynthesis C-methylase UbiE